MPNYLIIQYLLMDSTFIFFTKNCINCNFWKFKVFCNCTFHTAKIRGKNEGKVWIQEWFASFFPIEEYIWFEIRTYE